MYILVTLKQLKIPMEQTYSEVKSKLCYSLVHDLNI